MRLRVLERTFDRSITHTIAGTVGALCLALSAAPATAAIIDNGMSAIDTGTGLEWLDLTQTLGLTWNQVEASSFVTVDGYAHATDEQVIQLFQNAGFLTTDNTSNAANDPAAATLLGALGCTQFCGTANALGRGFADWDGTFTTRPFYRASALGAAAATTSLLSSNLDLSDASAGHYLVRAVVPEPGTALLVGAGLAILGACRRR